MRAGAPGQPRRGGEAGQRGGPGSAARAPGKEWCCPAPGAASGGPRGQSGGSALSVPLPERAAPPDPGPTAGFPRPPYLPAARRVRSPALPPCPAFAPRPRSAHRPRLPRPSGPKWQRGPPGLRQRLGEVGRDVRRRRVPPAAAQGLQLPACPAPGTAQPRCAARGRPPGKGGAGS